MENQNANENTIKAKLGMQTRWSENGVEDIYGGN